tara:strand:- start:20 stop:238 length:219 start_codon:yes stop_codon:yes gene_type:complete
LGIAGGLEKGKAFENAQDVWGDIDQALRKRLKAIADFEVTVNAEDRFWKRTSMLCCDLAVWRIIGLIGGANI